ncbi:hypothetical protein PG996_011344 [Apiospora saccharicola]|uniref:Uncharacterized protein n=1 Tax=Apiospora saccharicola TaxID=335842 RepID=A0ABR1UES3_9PEZI
MFDSGADAGSSRSGFAGNTSGKAKDEVSIVALDNNSEEYILQGLVPVVPAGITKTVQVTVENRSNYGKGDDMA